MNITNKDYAILSAAVSLLETKYETSKDYEILLIKEAGEVLDRLDEKKRKINERNSRYILEKRKVDPSYAGGTWRPTKRRK